LSTRQPFSPQPARSAHRLLIFSAGSSSAVRAAAYVTGGALDSVPAPSGTSLTRPHVPWRFSRPRWSVAGFRDSDSVCPLMTSANAELVAARPNDHAKPIFIDFGWSASFWQQRWPRSARCGGRGDQRDRRCGRGGLGPGRTRASQPTPSSAAMSCQPEVFRCLWAVIPVATKASAFAARPPGGSSGSARRPQ
jgi:hypothetical protein